MTSSACMRMSMSAATGLCCPTAAAVAVASACSAGTCPAHAACSSSNTGLQHCKQAFPVRLDGKGAPNLKKAGQTARNLSIIT